jgi:hypothetical protein
LKAVKTVANSRAPEERCAWVGLVIEAVKEVRGEEGRRREGESG